MDFANKEGQGKSHILGNGALGWARGNVPSGTVVYLPASKGRAPFFGIAYAPLKRPGRGVF